MSESAIAFRLQMLRMQTSRPRHPQVNLVDLQGRIQDFPKVRVRAEIVLRSGQCVRNINLT